MSDTFFRRAILAMDGYAPGEQPPPGKFIKLNTNENPYPPSPAVSRAIRDVTDSALARYPDPLATAFRLARPTCWGSSPSGFCVATAATIF